MGFYDASEGNSFLFLIRIFECVYFEIYFAILKSGRNWDFMTRVKEIDVREDLSRRS